MRSSCHSISSGSESDLESDYENVKLPRSSLHDLRRQSTGHNVSGEMSDGRHVEYNSRHSNTRKHFARSALQYTNSLDRNKSGDEMLTGTASTMMQPLVTLAPMVLHPQMTQGPVGHCVSALMEMPTCPALCELRAQIQELSRSVETCTREVVDVRREVGTLRHEVSSVQGVKDDLDDIRENIERLEEQTRKRKLRLLEQGLTCFLAYSIFSAVLGMFQFGYNTGVINAPQSVIEDFIVEAYTKRYGGIKEEVRNRATVIYAIAVAIFAVGGMIGGFGGGILANKLGRKRGLLLNNLMGIAGACLMGFCKYPNSYEMLIIGRFIIGFYCGLNTSLVPMYISEIAPLTLRGGLGTVNQLGVTIGLLVSQVLGIQQLLGNPEGWHLLLGITLCPAILQLVLFSFCPESPRHLLITKNREEEARKALRRLRASHHIEADIEEMKAEERAEQAEARTTLCQLIRTTSLRNPLVIAIVMQLSQQLSGINAVFYYSTVLFKNAGLSEEAAKYATTGIGVIMVTMTLISIPLMDKAGRRTLHLWGLGGMFIFSIFITISLLVKELIQWVTYLSVVSVLLFVVFFAVGPGSIPWMITAELFSQGPRPAAMSLAVLVNWMANFLVGIGFPALNAGLSSYVFLPFSILLAFFWVFTYRKVPETRNKTFEEIAAIFKSREDRMAQMQHLSTLAPPSAQENTALLAEEKFPKDGPQKHTWVSLVSKPQCEAWKDERKNEAVRRN
ncbi:glucose transporter type 1-like isoform X2 [Artemia franciscana]|uniref:glucose transporter type 1-like isoform X2 n=1 Tax=Artemia franciscana TaxID=6661 RepID=UPI0032DBC236